MNDLVKVKPSHTQRSAFVYAWPLTQPETSPPLR